MDSARGKLLIAGPTLQDPNFWRTVVLIVEHSEAGALGLVLNRPSGSTVTDAVPELSEIVAEPDEEILVGGPVSQSAVIVLGDFDNPEHAALIAFDSVGVLAGATDTDPDAPEEADADPAGAATSATADGQSADADDGIGDAAALGLRRARVFAGHAGWGPGQLDGELARGDWILEPARYADAFAGEPRALWSHVLERKGGSYALVARMPPDPSLN